jgi:histidine triad (HIT) family protein
MSDCLFCKIIDREIPGAIVYEDERIVAFKDINPQAPVHVLVVPKRHHIASLNDLTPEDDQIIGEVIRRGASIAKEHGISQSGFRVVFNTNADAGQAVAHIHLHVIGGRRMNWPPG